MKQTYFTNLLPWLAVVVSLLVLLTSYTKVFASEYETKNAEEISQIATDQMSDDLLLNIEQVGKVQEINLQFFESLSKLRETSKSNKIARLRELRSLASQRDLAFEEIMTDEQFKSYKEASTERKKQMRELIKARRQ